MRPAAVGLRTPVPFTYTRYPVTPTLSVAGVQVSATLVLVTLPIARFVGGAGGVVSGEGGGIDGQLEVVGLTRVRAERLPAKSTASTPNQYDVPQARPPWVDDVDVTDDIFVPFR